MISDAFVLHENHGGSRASGELFVDGGSAPVVVMLSQGELNGTKGGDRRAEMKRCAALRLSVW